MRKITVGGLLVGMLIGWILVARSQSLAAPARGVSSTQTLATCPPPATGTTWYCETFTGPYVSLNGAAYVAIPLAAVVGGVTSISVNAGTPQTGAVTLTIPSKVVVTSTAVLQ